MRSSGHRAAPAGGRSCSDHCSGTRAGSALAEGSVIAARPGGAAEPGPTGRQRCLRSAGTDTLGKQLCPPHGHSPTQNPGPAWEWEPTLSHGRKRRKPQLSRISFSPLNPEIIGLLGNGVILHLSTSGPLVCMPFKWTHQKFPGNSRLFCD